MSRLVRATWRVDADNASMRRRLEDLGAELAQARHNLDNAMEIVRAHDEFRQTRRYHAPPGRSGARPTGCGAPGAAARMPEPDTGDLWDAPAAGRGDAPARRRRRRVRGGGPRRARRRGPETVERLVSLCDGHRSLSEIAAALDDADRDEVPRARAGAGGSRGARGLHQAYRVFHWQSSVESDYFREPDEAQPVDPR